VEVGKPIDAKNNCVFSMKKLKYLKKHKIPKFVVRLRTKHSFIVLKFPTLFDRSIHIPHVKSTSVDIIIRDKKRISQKE